MTYSRCRIKKCGVWAAQGQCVIQHLFLIMLVIRIVQSAVRSIVTPHIADM